MICHSDFIEARKRASLFQLALAYLYERSTKMTIRTIKATEEEANKIIENKVRFVIRSDKAFFKENDIIKFRVIKNMHDVLHKIDSKNYVVTAVMDHRDAPIIEGHQFVAFREI